MSTTRQLLEQAKLDAAQIGFSTIFNNRLQIAPSAIMDMGLRVPSANAEEQFMHLGDVPMLTEWSSDRKFSKLRTEKITIRARDFSAGIEVHRNDIMDDRLGLVVPRVMMLADRARQHVAKSMIELLLNGFTGTAFPEVSDGLAYDGQLFFSAAHQDGDGPTQSNVGTAALDSASYEAARVAMQSLQDEEGQPLEINPQTLVVGPSNERTALEVVNAGLIDQGGAAGVENVFRGTARVVVSQRLVGAYANYWFLADLGQPVRPLIWVDREAPFMVAQNRVDDEHAFTKNMYRWGVQYRAGYGYGLWQHAWGSDGTT